MDLQGATITYKIAIYTTNSYGMILVQKMPLFYGETFVTFGYQLMLTLFVQLMGMGFASYLRRFSVYPVKALWPTILPTIAMNRALTWPVCCLSDAHRKQTFSEHAIVPMLR